MVNVKRKILWYESIRTYSKVMKDFLNFYFNSMQFYFQWSLNQLNQLNQLNHLGLQKFPRKISINCSFDIVSEAF